MSDRLRWGILGPGGIAQGQVGDLLENGFPVQAVGSRSQERAREFADRYGIPTAHGSYEDLVADPEVDVIYVATPHSGHYPHVRLALEAGKHVLVEKPFTVTAPQAEALARIAEDAGLVLLEAMWTRYLPHMVRLREMIAEGVIGDARTIIADHSQKVPADPESRMNRLDLAGGALLDLGIYPVSFAWDLFGEPTAVSAEGTMTASGVDRQTAIMLGFDGGRQAVLHCSLDAPGPNTAVVLGTEGWIRIDPVWYTATSFTVFGVDGTELDRYESNVRGRGMHFQAEELERLVAERSTAGSILPPGESARIMGTLDEVRRQIGLEYPAEITGL